MKYTDRQRIQLAREALDDWRNGQLSDGSALFAISIALTPSRKPTKAEIDIAKKIEAGLRVGESSTRK